MDKRESHGKGAPFVHRCLIIHFPESSCFYCSVISPLGLEYEITVTQQQVVPEVC